MSHDATLIDRLPAVRGRLTAGANLGPLTWFRVGGPADVLFKPADRDDLMAFLAAKPADVPVTVLGVGSNVLVRDGGIPGVVIRLGGPFAMITVDGDVISAGAGALDLNVSLTARDAGLAGLEFLRGIPGTIGGGLRMNAGAYGAEMTNIVIDAEAVDGQGRLHRLTPAELGFTYRHSAVPADWIFIGCRLQGRRDDVAAIGARMDQIVASREATQPTRGRTGGSTFTNPPGQKAWSLIDQAGCRGLRRGDAVVSELHCNFLINEGTASAADIEALGETVREKVKAASGVTLDWEIKRLGRPAGSFA